MSDIAQTSATQTLATIVGPSGVCLWEALDANLQSQIAQAISSTHTVSPLNCLVYPHTQDELAAVVACAHTHGWRMLPCGSGSKLHWGTLATNVAIALSTARLDRLIDHAAGDLTVTAEAGMRLADLQAVLAEKGQFLPIDPAYADCATLGGIVATADTGGLRQRYGGIRDLLIGLSFVRSDGRLVKAGGRVVKNVAGYDLMKLLTGAYGTLGIISQLTFRIYPLPPASRSLLLTGEAGAIAQATALLLNSALTPTAIAVLPTQTIVALDRGSQMGLLTRFQSMTVSVEEQTNHLSKLGQTLGLQAAIFAESDESALWRALRERIQAPSPESTVTCKVGVSSAKTVQLLTIIDALAIPLQFGWVYGNGLGMLQFAASITPQELLKLRQRCQAYGGFLTVLSAPIALKQTFDCWGYTGNARSLMTAIKQQFDPDHLLSPDRFLIPDEKSGSNPNS